MPGDVQDRLPAVVERRADVEARATASVVVGPALGCAVEDPLGRLEPDAVATAAKSPPSISVAEVKTTVLSASSLSRIGPHTWSGATQSRGGMPLGALGEPEHVGVESAAIRSAVAKISCTAPLAWVSAGVALVRASPSLGKRRDQRAGGVADQRERVGELARARGRCGPGSASSIAVAQRVGGVGEVVGLVALDVALARRAARSTSAADSSSVAAWVTRAVSSWASSITTTSYSGIIGTPSIASIASSEWLVTTSWERCGLLLGPLGEALLAERALGRAEALAVVDADLAPDPVGVPRRVVALAAALGLGLLLGPLAQREHLVADRPLGQVDQRALVVGHALADPVQAGVVGAALEHGVRRVDARDARSTASTSAGRSRSTSWCCSARVAVATTTRSSVQQRRDEVGQRLAGAGAGLDEQVLGAAPSPRRPPRPSAPGRGAPARRARPPRSPAARSHRVVRGWLGHPRTLAASCRTPARAPSPGGGFEAQA